MKNPFKNPKYPVGRQAAIMLLTRYLYIFLTISLLGKAWYQGSGSYQIAFSWEKEVFASLAFLLELGVLLKRRVRDEFSKTVLHLLFTMYYMPLNAAFSLNDESYLFFALSNVYFLLLILLLSSRVRWVRRKKKAQPTVADGGKGFFYNNVTRIVFFLLCVIYIVYKISYNGFSVSLSMVSDLVYGNRAAYQESLDAMSGSFASYALALLRNIVEYVAPVYLFISLQRKKAFPIAVSLLCILSMYSVSSGKGMLFFVVILFFIFYCYKKGILSNFEKIFDYCFLALLVLCLVEMLIFGKSVLYTYLIRRELYLPAWLNTLYFDYFSVNPKIMWSQNTFLLQNLLPDVYDRSPLEIINATYFAGSVPSPNTGMFAEAVMHFGVVGVFVYPFLLNVLIKKAGKVYMGCGEGLCMMMAAKLVLSLTNVPIVRTDFVLSFVMFTVILWAARKLRIGQKMSAAVHAQPAKE